MPVGRPRPCVSHAISKDADPFFLPFDLVAPSPVAGSIKTHRFV